MMRKNRLTPVFRELSEFLGEILKGKDRDERALTVGPGMPPGINISFET